MEPTEQLRGATSRASNLDSTGETDGVGHERDLTIVPVRPWGTWVAALLVAGVAGFMVWALLGARIEYSLIPEYFLNDLVLRGMLNTITLTLICMAIGIVLGVTAAIMGRSANPILRGVALFYISAFRGTPVLVQLLLWFNLSLVLENIGIPGIYSVSTNSVMTPFVTAILALGINEGSYMAEIVRSGILSVDKGQFEAAQSVGLRKGQVMRRIVLPQALRVIIPPSGNEFISMLKFTSLAYVVSYSELLGAAYKIYSTNLKVVELLLTVSIWYLILTSILSLGQYYLEKRLNYESGGGLFRGFRMRRRGGRISSE